MSEPSAWFNHVFEAPMTREARQAVQRLIDATDGDRPLPASRRSELISSARAAVGDLLAAAPEEIILTSGGTEAANLAIKGVAGARRAGAGRLVTTAVEHTAILHPIRTLARDGFELVLLPVSPSGKVDLDRAERALGRGAALLSVQHANHEVGTIQPIESLAAMARAHGVLFHVDAVATAGLLPLRPERWGVDLLSLSASRLGGAPGAGALWSRPGVRLQPQIEGGVQEGGLRAGAENLLGLAAFEAAARAASGREAARAQHTRGLRDRLEDGLARAVDGLRKNGPSRDARLPGHLHLSVPGVEGESLLFRLRRAGIEASSGSACAGEAGKPSHVLEAMGVDRGSARCSVLFSLGPGSRRDEVDLALEVVPRAVADLRAVSAS